MGGLPDLLVALMVAGDIDALDARNPRLAHCAISALAEIDSEASRRVLAHFDVEVRVTPNPDVGARVSGLTGATWIAVSRGMLEPHEAGHDAWFTVTESARAHVHLLSMCLDPTEEDILRHVGADWAFASTRRKKRARAGRSPASKRSLSWA